MAIFRFSNAGGFGTYQRYNDFLAGNPAVILDKGSMYPIGVFTLSAAQTSIEFTDIPQTYTHLQIRYIARSSAAVNGTNLILKPNNDSGTYYSHGLVGTGSSVLAGNTSVDGVLTYFVVPGANATANVFGGGFVDLLDYRNTNKNKTQRQLAGWDNNGSGQIALNSQLWQSTTAISSIYLTLSDGNFAANSSFALYGIQA